MCLIKTVDFNFLVNMTVVVAALVSEPILSTKNWSYSVYIIFISNIATVYLCLTHSLTFFFHIKPITNRILERKKSSLWEYKTGWEKGFI